MSNDEIKWKLFAAGTALLVSTIIRKSLETGWKVATHEDPPNEEDATKDNMTQLIVWTTISSIAIGVGQILARRGAYEGWRQITGKKPPVD